MTCKMPPAHETVLSLAKSFSPFSAWLRCHLDVTSGKPALTFQAGEYPAFISMSLPRILCPSYLL